MKKTPSARAPRPPSVNRVLTTAMLAVFATTLFVRALDPVIPPIAHDFNVAPSTVALLATAFALPYAIMQPLLGGLADAFGKARLMTYSLVALLLAALVGAAAPNIYVLFASRMVAGALAGGVFPIGLAIVGDLVPVKDRQVAISRLLGAGMLGNLMGSPATGMVADYVGWRGVFFLMAGLAMFAIVAAVIGFRGMPRTEAGKADLSTLPATYRSIFANPLAKICYISVLTEAVVLFGLFPYMATLLQAGGETRAAIAGVVLSGFGAGGLVYATLVRHMLNILGERRLMISGGTIMGLAIMTVALRLSWQADFVTFAVLGFGFYTLHGVIQIYASELAPHARGSAMALHSSFFFFGNAIGPIVYGVALPTVGLTATVVASGLVLITVGLVCSRWLRRDPVSGRPAAG